MQIALASERIADVGEQLLPLIEECYAGIDSPVPCEAPTLAALEARERNGETFFTLRAGDELIGFASARLIGNGGATDGGVFVKAQHRGVGNILRVIERIHAHMKQLGATWFVWDCDEGSGSHILAERLGHRLLSRRYFTHL